MDYKMTYHTMDGVVLEANDGIKIKLLFREQDNMDTEDAVLENLVCSYEKRMMDLT